MNLWDPTGTLIRQVDTIYPHEHAGSDALALLRQRSIVSSICDKKLFVAYNHRGAIIVLFPYFYCGLLGDWACSYKGLRGVVYIKE